jgi:hypothetical protein
MCRKARPSCSEWTECQCAAPGRSRLQKGAKWMLAEGADLQAVPKPATDKVLKKVWSRMPKTAKPSAR